MLASRNVVLSRAEAPNLPGATRSAAGDYSRLIRLGRWDCPDAPGIAAGQGRGRQQPFALMDPAGSAWISGKRRILEDHRHLVAADVPGLRVGCAAGPCPPAWPARRQCSFPGQQPHDRQPRSSTCHGRTPHRAKRHTVLDLQVERPDRLHDGPGERDTSGQVTDLRDGGHPGNCPARARWAAGPSGPACGRRRADRVRQEEDEDRDTDDHHERRPEPADQACDHCPRPPSSSA